MKRLVFAWAAVWVVGCSAPDADQLVSGLAARLVPPAHAQPRVQASEAPPESGECAAVPPLQVLFVGNSYVIQSDTPGFLQAMSEDAGVGFHVERLARGGKDFAYHLGRRRTEQVLDERA